MSWVGSDEVARSVVSWIRSGSLEIPTDDGLELHESIGVDREVPLEVRTHFAFRLVDLVASSCERSMGTVAVNLRGYGHRERE